MKRSRVQSVSEKPFVLFLSAIIPSAILVCGAALLFPLTVTGRGLSKSGVELPAAMPTNVAQLSTHAKSAEPTAQRQIDPESAPIPPTPLETIDPDLTASIPGQPEIVTEHDAVVGPPETDPFSAEHDSAFNIAIDETNVSEAPGRSANASPYGARVWAALARHESRAAQRGSTTVTFEIGASGALGYVRVSQSSGNAGLDQIALQTVRNAAPFPLPPNGASSYTIRIDFQ